MNGENVGGSGKKRKIKEKWGENQKKFDFLGLGAQNLDLPGVAPPPGFGLVSTYGDLA